MGFYMNYKFDCDNWGSSFSVPTSVVSDYIKLSDGDFVKVLLCILSGNRRTTTAQLAKKCGVSESIVDDAVVHWSNLGVISVGGDEQNSAVEVPADTKVIPPEKVLPVSAAPAIRPENNVDKKIVVSYTQREIREKAEQDENLKRLVNDIQGTLQFSINGKELGRLVELYELYHFDVPTIMLAADYCASIGKRGIAYLSTVMIRWYEEDGISTYADVEKKIIECTEFNKFENQVLRIFGMDNKPSKQQKEYIRKWRNMGFSTELLEIAYNKCLDAKSKLSFSYIDGILAKWSEKAILTPEQVEINDAEFKSKNSYGNNKSEEGKKNSYDLDKFEQYALNFSLYDDEGTEN